MKRKYLFQKNEVVRLENEIVIFEIVFGMVHGQPNNKSKKSPISFDYSSLEISFILKSYFKM